MVNLPSDRSKRSARAISAQNVERRAGTAHHNEFLGSRTRPTWQMKISAKVVRHAKYVTFQMAEVAVPHVFRTPICDPVGGISHLHIGKSQIEAF